MSICATKQEGARILIILNKADKMLIDMKYEILIERIKIID